MGTRLLLCPENGGSGRALRGGHCSHPGQAPPVGGGHQGSGFHLNWEATEEWGAQPCSPHPSPGHQRSRPPAATSPNPHFHPSEGQPQRVQQDPTASTGTQVVPGSHPEGANPLAPRSPLPVGSEVRTSHSQTPMAQQQERRCRPRSHPLHPQQECGDPLGSGVEPPTRGHTLPAAAARSCSPPGRVSCLMSKL